MRWLPALCIIFPAPAVAHLGHLGDFAGHDHWVAGAAAGAAVAAGLWGWLKGRKDVPAKATEAEAEAEAGDA